jgi:hypothetical protein
VDAFVAEKGHNMDTNHIATLLHAVNKKRVRVTEATLDDLLWVWEERGGRLGIIPTTMIFQGLSLVKGAKDRTLAPRMLSCLANTVTSCSEKFEGRNISQCLYALRHLDAG